MSAATHRGAGVPVAVLSLQPPVLYEASIERIEEAHLLALQGRAALAMYAAGLAVECLLQAFALRRRQRFDARHDLTGWLAKGPAELIDAVRGRAAGEWSVLIAIWSNRLRYMSDAGLLGYLRDKQLHRHVRGGPKSLLTTRTRECVNAATTVHRKGLVVWPRAH